MLPLLSSLLRFAEEAPLWRVSSLVLTLSLVVIILCQLDGAIK